MNPITSPVTRSWSLATLVLPIALCGLAPAVTLTYDANTSTSGAQDGAGTGWNTSATNFWNGSSNVAWPNTNVDEAIFGAFSGVAGTVTTGSVTANKVTFNAATSGSYTLTGGGIALSGTSPAITTNADATIASPITGSTGLIKAGSGTLILTSTGNTYTGGTNVLTGMLQIGNGTTNGAPGSGAYAIAAGATLRLSYNASGAVLPAWANYSGAGTIALKTLKNNDAAWGTTALPTTFTGKLLIESGRTNLNTGGVGLGGTTTVEVRPGGHLGMWVGGAQTANFIVAGTGYGESGYEGALRFGNGGFTTTLNGTFTLSADATIGASGGTGIIVQPITEVTAGTNLRLGSSAMTGIVELRGACTYTGTTTVAFGSLLLSNALALQYSTLASGGVVFNNTVVSNAFTVGGLSGSGTVTLANNATTPAPITLTFGNDGADTTHTGTVTGAGNLVKTGSCFARLAGVTSYTGTTSVNKGRLHVPTGTATTGACTVADGAALGVTGASAQSWRCTSLSVGTSTGATLELPVMTATTAPPIVATTALTTAGTVTVKVSAPFTVGNFPLIKYPAGSIGGAGFAAFALAPLPQGVVATLVDDPGTGTISLNVTTANSLTWQGAPSSTWDVGTSTAWTLGGSPTVFQNGSMDLFDDTATGSTNVTVSGSVSPFSLSVNNSTLNYTFSGSGSISGSTALLKAGTGTLTVTNANTYTGTTTVNGGTLKIGDGTTDGSLAGPIANNASVVFDTVGAKTYGGTLSGGGAGVTITKQGAGTLTLTGTNSFTGVTAVNAGTLRLGTGTTNAVYSGGNYTIPATGRLLIDNATAVSAATWGPKLSGAGLVELNTAQAADGSANWGPNLASANPIPGGFSGTIQVNRGRIDLSPTGVGGMTRIVLKDGAQFLGWAGNYPATLTAEIAGNGWGEAGQPGALRIAGGNVGTWAGPIVLTANAGILSQAGGSVFTLTGSITGLYECNFIRNGNIIVAPTAPVRNSYGSTRIGSSGGTGFVSAGNANAFSPGALVMDGGALYLNGFSFDFANLSGATGEIRNNHATDPVTLTVGATGDTVYAGSLINGGVGKLSLTKTGTGALRLTGNVAYTGDTTVSGGVLQVAAPTTTVISGNCSVAGSSELGVTGLANSVWHSDQMNLAAGSALTIRNFYSNPSIAPVEVDTTMTTAGTVTLNVPAGNFETGVFPLIYYPVGTGLGGAGYGAFTLGSLPRSVSATIQDDTGNSAVNLNIAAVNPLKWKGNLSGAWDIATTKNWTLASVAENYLEGDMVLFDDTATTFAVTLAGNVAPATVSFDNTANNYTLSGAGAITGAGKLTKAGDGKLTLSGSHTYTGGTTVNGGTLELGDAVTLAGTITDNANVSFNITGTQAMPTGITGTGTVTKAGVGTLTIASAQAYTGGTIVSGGMVKMSGTNNGASSAGAGTLSIGSGATVEANSHNVLGQGPSTNLSPLVINGGSFLNDQYLHLNSLTMTGGTFGIRAGVTQVDGLDLRVRNSALPSVTTLANATSAIVSSKITLRDATTVTVADGAAASDLVISGAIVGTVALNKEGPGTLELSGVNTYTGATNVNAGTLRLSAGSLANTVTTIASGATLTGASSITGAVNVQSGAFIAPGNNGVGTLATGAGTLAGTYTCQLDGATADRINVTGALNVEGATIAFSTINPPTAASYIIATYTGAISGNPAAVTGIPAGYSLDVLTPGQIRLIAGYSAWATTMGLDGTPGKENGLADDPDKDGIDNLSEFYLDGNPLASNQAILPVRSLDATHLILTFKRRDDAEADVTSQAIQYGTTLTGWTTVALGAASATDGNGVVVTIVENGTAADDITVKIPRTLGPAKLFGRLRVTK